MQINWSPEKRKLADLKHWEKNPRKISEEKFSELKDKILKRGFHDVIKIDTDNTILSGNMRKDALEQLGIKEVNVLVPDRKLTVEEMVLVGLESNVLSGEWDWAELSSWKDKDLLLSAGFSEEELMVNSGLYEADLQEVDLDRMKIIEVYPPESVRLKEKVAIHFSDINNYNKFKNAVRSGALSEQEIMKLI